MGEFWKGESHPPWLACLSCRDINLRATIVRSVEGDDKTSLLLMSAVVPSMVATRCACCR